MMDYGEVLERAWHIIWKNKILWIFGILAGCGGNASYNGGGQSRSNVNYNINPNDQFNQYFGPVQRFFENIPVWVWVLVVLAFIVLAIIFYIIHTFGAIGLIKGAVEADDGATSLSFGNLWSQSLPYFWRVFFLNILVGLAILAAGLVLMVPIILLGVATLGIGLLCILPFLCLLIPAAWFVQIIIQQATNAIVIENLGIFAGLSRGWNVAIKNIGPMIVMGLVLLVGGAIIGFLLSLPVFLIFVPPLIGYMTGGQNMILGSLLVSAIIFIVYLPFLLVGTGILRSYTSTAWTLTFRRLTTPRPPEPVVIVDAPVAPEAQ
jgi:hypothetical protein